MTNTIVLTRQSLYERVWQDGDGDQRQRRMSCSDIGVLDWSFI